MRLNSKVCVITGTGGNMGRAAAMRFAAEGAAVVGCDTNPDAAQETLELVRAAGGRMISLHPVDLTAMLGCQKLVEFAIREHGRIDVLFNNAAKAHFNWIEDITEDEWRLNTRDEVDLVFFLTKAAGPHLKASGGTIVNTASLSGWRVFRIQGGLAHATAKMGIVGMTSSWRWRDASTASAPTRSRPGSSKPTRRASNSKTRNGPTTCSARPSSVGPVSLRRSLTWRYFLHPMKARSLPRSMSRWMAEWPRGDSNAVAPGAIETDFGGGVVRDNAALNKIIAGQTALGRVGMPEDIGPLIPALLSDSGRWVNGAHLTRSAREGCSGNSTHRPTVARRRPHLKGRRPVGTQVQEE